MKLKINLIGHKQQLFLAYCLIFAGCLLGVAVAMFTAKGKAVPEIFLGQLAPGVCETGAVLKPVCNQPCNAVLPCTAGLSCVTTNNTRLCRKAQCPTRSNCVCPSPSPSRPPSPKPLPSPSRSPSPSPRPSPSPSASPTYSFERCTNGSTSCRAYCQSVGKVCAEACHGGYGLGETEAAYPWTYGTCSQTTSPIYGSSLTYFCNADYNVHCCCGPAPSANP